MYENFDVRLIEVDINIDFEMTGRLTSSRTYFCTIAEYKYV